MKKNFTSHTFYEDLLNQTHLLVAGETGSGKSVVINGMLTTAIYHSPDDVQFILLDPKRNELIDYKYLPHTMAYACELEDMVNALEYAVYVIDLRDREMGAKRLKQYDGSHIYIVIDELAYLMTTCPKKIKPLLQRIAIIGRAANVHLVLATQSPISKILDTGIKCNIDSRVALRTRSRQDSRNIIEMNGCETLPQYGKAFYMKPGHMAKVDVPKLEASERYNLIDFWKEAI